MTEPADDGVWVLVVVLVLEAELVADVVAVDALVTVLAVVVAPVLLVLIEQGFNGVGVDTDVNVHVVRWVVAELDEQAVTVDSVEDVLADVVVLSLVLVGVNACPWSVVCSRIVLLCVGCSSSGCGYSRCRSRRD